MTTTSLQPKRKSEWRSARAQNLFTDALFVLPALLIFTIFFVYPVLSSFYFSLTDWDGLNPQMAFVGLDNFVKMAGDRHFWSALRNTFKYAFLVTIIQNALGLALAMAVTDRMFRHFRVLFLIPALLSSMAIGTIWSYLYEPNFGAINQMLAAVGLTSLQQNWLGDPKLALYSLIATNTWRWVGMSMIIYLAGLQAIPVTIQEAASIDGVSPWQRFRHVTFPLIAPAFTINIVLSMIGSLKVFDIIYIMTQGGPGRATESITTYIFKRAFNFNQFGYGTAIAIVMFAIILVLSAIQLTLLLKREVRG